MSIGGTGEASDDAHACRAHREQMAIHSDRRDIQALAARNLA
jgi:hypothetical protein